MDISHELPGSSVPRDTEQSERGAQSRRVPVMPTGPKGHSPLPGLRGSAHPQELTLLNFVRSFLFNFKEVQNCDFCARIEKKVFIYFVTASSFMSFFSAGKCRFFFGLMQSGNIKTFFN